MASAARWFSPEPVGDTDSPDGAWFFAPQGTLPQHAQRCIGNATIGGLSISSGLPFGPGQPVGVFMFRTPALKAQTLTGTFDLLFAVRRSSDYLLGWYVHVWVSVGSTGAVRGVLVDNYSDSADWATTATFTGLSSPQTIADLDIEAGDQIVVELGYEMHESTVGSVQAQGTIYGGAGENALPGVVGDTNYNDACGYVQFSNSIAVEDQAVGDQCLGAPSDCECCVSSRIQIINDALYKLGISKTIASLDEQSQEAVCGVAHVDTVMKEVLRQHPWNFARKYGDSADAVSESDPMYLVGGTATEAYNKDWQYAYRYPIDCITARRLVREGTGKRYDESPATWEVGRIWTGVEDNDYRIVMTDEVDAVLEYTAFTECLDDIADPLFLDAASWRQAAKMAPSLTRSQLSVKDCLQAYELTLVRAAQIGAQEQQQEKPGNADWITAR